MAGASIETTLEIMGEIAAGCEDADTSAVHAAIGSARSAGQFLGRLVRVTSRARQAGCARKRRVIQDRGVSRRFSGRGRWDADDLRDIVRDYVARNARR